MQNLLLVCTKFKGQIQEPQWARGGATSPAPLARSSRAGPLVPEARRPPLGVLGAPKLVRGGGGVSWANTNRRPRLAEFSQPARLSTRAATSAHLLRRQQWRAARAAQLESASLARRVHARLELAARRVTFVGSPRLRPGQREFSAAHSCWPAGRVHSLLRHPFATLQLAFCGSLASVSLSVSLWRARRVQGRRRHVTQAATCARGAWRAARASFRAASRRRRLFARTVRGARGWREGGVGAARGEQRAESREQKAAAQWAQRASLERGFNVNELCRALLGRARGAHKKKQCALETCAQEPLAGRGGRQWAAALLR